MKQFSHWTIMFLLFLLVADVVVIVVDITL